MNFLFLLKHHLLELKEDIVKNINVNLICRTVLVKKGELLFCPAELIKLIKGHWLCSPKQSKTPYFRGIFVNKIPNHDRTIWATKKENFVKKYIKLMNLDKFEWFIR